ncbi:ubiquitin-protein ligase (E3) [Entomophthora muscae]|uniref:Ubiquitin-protein ligase (E3) n=1 Tax=Entomophthora muscae TaxID=34485 RepID=A0ACC2TAG7_9FUNG|nr:ubiquitin-protein ligase (E3) [Entomophthora muscae]
MWSFEGNARSRSKINLGGRVAAVSKEEILQKTREERRKREEERKRQQAAAKIQRNYRRHVESCILKTKLRKEFDLEAELIIKNNPDWQGFYTLVQKLVVFFESTQDLNRLSILLKLALTRPSSVPVFFSPLSEPSLCQWWSAVMSRFLSLALQCLSIAAPDSIFLILLGLDIHNYSHISIVHDREALYQRILRRLVSKGLLSAISNCLKMGKDGELLVNAIGYLFASSRNDERDFEVVCDCFHYQLFSCTVFSQVLPPEGVMRLMRSLPIWQLLDVLLNQLMESPCEMSCMDRLTVIYQNLSSMESLVIEQPMSGELIVYFSCLEKILALGIPDDYASLDADSDTHPDAPEVQHPTNAEFGSRMFLGQACEYALGKVTGPNDPLLEMLGKYCTQILVGWPQLEGEVLGFLLHRQSSLRRGLVPMLCERTLLTARTLDFGTSYLLIRLLLRQLEVLGDNPMVEESGQELLTPPQAQALIPVLGNCLFSMYWDVSDAVLSARMAGHSFTTSHFRHLATALLRQIHDKNSRFQFLPSSVWSEPWAQLRQNDFAVNAANELFQIHQQDDDEQDLPTPPRVAILRSIPFIVPFEIRVDIFSRCVALEKERSEGDGHSFLFRSHNAPVNIRRDKVFEDGFAQLNPLGSGLKGRVSITMVSSLGMPEAGIDGGGVFKEFLNALIKQAFAPETDLFLTTPAELLYPSPHRANREHPRLRQYEFLGRMVGKALFEGILIDASFARFFLSKWLGRRSFLDDLPSLDDELYAGLMSLLRYDGDPEDMALNFTLVDREPSGPVNVELVRGGERLPVTAANKFEYVRLVADYRLNIQLQRQSRAFLGGLIDILPPRWLQMFDPAELQMVISGGRQPIDVQELQTHITYSGVYHAEHPTIVAFWSVVHGLETDTLALLIKFITSCSRPPLQGFKALSPPMCIRDSGRDDGRLPTASTCVNLLKLPIYSSPEALKNKLLYAIHSESGFELS